MKGWNKLYKEERLPFNRGSMRIPKSDWGRTQRKTSWIRLLNQTTKTISLHSLQKHWSSNSQRINCTICYQRTCQAKHLKIVQIMKKSRKKNREVTSKSLILCGHTHKKTKIIVFSSANVWKTSNILQVNLPSRWTYWANRTTRTFFNLRQPIR